MARKTASIERYHVWGTPNYCLSMFYRTDEMTPRDPASFPGHRALPAWIPDDATGIERMRVHAKANGFTHVRFVGDWERRVKPSGGKIP